jgi:hypothetical protein
MVSISSQIREKVKDMQNEYEALTGSLGIRSGVTRIMATLLFGIKPAHIQNDAFRVDHFDGNRHIRLLHPCTARDGHPGFSPGQFAFNSRRTTALVAPQARHTFESSLPPGNSQRSESEAVRKDVRLAVTWCHKGGDL